MLPPKNLQQQTVQNQKWRNGSKKIIKTNKQPNQKEKTRIYIQTLKRSSTSKQNKQANVLYGNSSMCIFLLQKMQQNQYNTNFVLIKLKMKQKTQEQIPTPSKYFSIISKKKYTQMCSQQRVNEQATTKHENRPRTNHY